MNSNQIHFEGGLQCFLNFLHFMYIFIFSTLIFPLFSLLLLKVKLEQSCVGGDQALVTCKQLLETWKQVYDSDLSG